MVEVAALVGVEKGLELALLAEAGTLQGELVVPTLVILGTVVATHEIIKAVRRHREEKRAEEQARIDAEQARIAQEQAAIAEEQRIQEVRELSAEEMQQYGITAENLEETILELERIARIEGFKKRDEEEDKQPSEQNATPDEVLLYPPGLREEIDRLRAEEQEARRLEEDRRRAINGGNGGGNDPDPDPNGGNDPDGNDEENKEERKNNNPYGVNINPFAEKLKNAGSKLLGQFGNLLIQKEDAQDKADKGEISQEEKDQIDRNIEIQQNQLEAQKQMLDILEAIGIGELTQEESLAELSNIEDQIKKMDQRNAPVQVQNIYTNTVSQF